MEVNSFIIRQAFGTLMAIEIVNFMYENWKKFRTFLELLASRRGSRRGRG